MFVEKEIIMDIYKLVEVFLRKSTLVSLLIFNNILHLL